MRIHRLVVPLLLSACGAPTAGPKVSLLPLACETTAQCPDDTPFCSPSVGRCYSTAFFSDSSAPSLVKATALDLSRVTLTFNEEIAQPALANLSMSGGITIVGVEVDNVTATLYTSPLRQGFAYDVTAARFVDIAGNEAGPVTATVVAPGTPPDRRPPEAVVPAEGARLAALDVSFVWVGRAGAGDYTIEVSTDAQFGSVLTTVQATGSPAQLTLPTDGTYFWRVRADTSDEPSPAQSFSVLGGCVRVFCPGGADCTGGLGTRQTPLRDLREAVALARQLDLACIEVASRDDESSYTTGLSLSDKSFQVIGGFNPDFTPGAARTKLTGGVLGTFVAMEAKDVLLQNFELTQDRSTLVAFAAGCTSVTLTNLVVNAKRLDGVAAVFVLDSGAVALQDVTVKPATLGQPERFGTAIGIEQVGIATLRGIEALGFLETGVRLSSGTFELEDVTIMGGSAGPESRGLVVERALLDVRRARIVAGSGGSESIGALLRHAVASFDACQVSGGSAPSGRASAGIEFELPNAVGSTGEASLRVTNSVLFSGQAGSTPSISAALQIDSEAGAVSGRSLSAFPVTVAHTVLVAQYGATERCSAVDIYAVESGAKEPLPVALINDIFTTVGAPTGDFAVIRSVDAATSYISRLQNSIFDIPPSVVLYSKENGAVEHTTIDQLVGATGTPGSFISGLEQNSSLTFADSDGADGDFYTLEDNNWRVGPTGATNLRIGLILDPEVTTDLAGLPRTRPPAVGAYEPQP